METWKARCKKCGDFNPAAFNDHLREFVNRPSFFPIYLSCPNPKCTCLARVVYNTVVLDVEEALFHWNQADYIKITNGKLELVEYPQGSYEFGLLRLGNPIHEEMFVRLPNISNYFEVNDG